MARRRVHVSSTRACLLGIAFFVPIWRDAAHKWCGVASYPPATERKQPSSGIYVHGNGNAHSANLRVCEPRPWGIDENSIDEQTVFNSGALRCHHGDQLQRTGNLRCRSRPFDCSLLSSLPLRNEVRRSIHEFKMNSMATLPRLQLFGKSTKKQPRSTTLADTWQYIKIATHCIKIATH